MQVFVMIPTKGFGEVREAIRDATNVVGADVIIIDELPDPGKITKQIMAQIRLSHICIAEITDKNPNVVWELGYAQSLGKEAIPITQSSDQFFHDIGDQRGIVYQRDNLRLLTQKLVSALNNINSHSPNVPKEDLVGTKGHDTMTQVLAAPRIRGTPYGIFDLIPQASSHVFISAQNHYFLVDPQSNNARFRDSLEQFLKKKDARIDILLCDLSNAGAMATWRDYVARDPRYESDLKKATESFLSLRTWAAQQGVSDRVVIRRTPFVPISINFVDPDSERGFLVLVPNAYEGKNLGRACFVVSRSKNNEIFEQYWSSYSHIFGGAPELI